MTEPIDLTQYDEVGVTLSLDKKGRFIAKRVFLKDDKVVKSIVLTQGRAAAFALKDASFSLQRIVTDWNRGLVGLDQPEAFKLPYEDGRG